MTERDEQGFVKDIKVAIEEINNETKSPMEKFKELIELPFSVEDVISVDEYVNSLTNGKVDSHDELYSLAIINEQMNGLDEIFKPKFEERHNDLVEALMNRMEGVLDMYDVNENENVLGVDPTLEQPVEVQTPQLDEFNPENLAEPMEVVAGEPIASVDAPEMVAPTVDPTLFAEPTGYGEVPEMEAPTFEPAVPEVVAPEVPSFEDFINSNDFEVPAEEPVMEAPVEEPAVEEPVAEVAPEVPSFADFINNMPEVQYEEPTAYGEIPPMEEAVEEPVAEVPVSAPEIEIPTVEAYEEPAVEPVVETPVEEPVAENTEEDDGVKEIIDRYEKLKNLNVKVYNDQKQLRELENKMEELRTEISNNQEEIKKLAA